MGSKAEQLAAIRADQEFWRNLAAEGGPGRYAEPGPMGEWTFGDMAGRLVAWRNRTIARLEAAGRGEPDPAPPWPADMDDDDVINGWMHEQDAGRTPEDLVSEYDAAYDRLISAIGALPEERLTDPDAFPWLGIPLVDADFTVHLHEEHVPSVRAWLDGAAG